MKRILLSASLLLVNAIAVASPKIGEPAPAFKDIPASDGQKYSSEGLLGKYVVLEWWNEGCPYVKKHYESGNMQALQTELKDKVVWLTVLSSAPGLQGYMDAAGASKTMKASGAAQKAVLLDPDGKLGKLYEAKTTPHMFIINPEGKLVYKGAIDDKPTTDKKDITGAKNYVRLAMNALPNGKFEQSTKPYGCSVKYK